MSRDPIPVIVRWPCIHGYHFSHYLKPHRVGRLEKCEGGFRVALRRPAGWIEGQTTIDTPHPQDLWEVVPSDS